MLTHKPQKKRENPLRIPLSVERRIRIHSGIHLPV